MSDEVSIINKITQTVNQSEIQILFEKQSCKIKSKFISMYKDQLKALEIRTAEMEKRYSELCENKTKLESNFKSLQENNAVTGEYIICLNKQLSIVQNTFLERSKQSKEDSERLEAEYNEQIRKYECIPLAVERQKLQNLKKKYSSEAAEIDAKLQFFQRNQEYYRKLQDNETSQQIIRLAKYFKDKQLLRELEGRIRTKEAMYMALVTNKDKSAEIVDVKDAADIAKNTDINFHNKLKLIDLTQLEMTNIRQSPGSDEENTSQNNVVQTEQNNKQYIGNQMQNITKIYQDDTDTKKSTADLITSSFWRKTSEKKPVINNENSLKTVTNIRQEQIMNNPNKESVVTISPTQQQEKYCATVNNSPDSEDGGVNNNFKKVNIIENVVLKVEDVAKILDKLPDQGTNNNERVFSCKDVIIQNMGAVKINNDNSPEYEKTSSKKCLRFNNIDETNNILENSGTENPRQTIKTKMDGDKDNVPMEVDQQENQQVCENPKQATYGNSSDDYNNVGKIINNENQEQAVSKFFTKSDVPPKDDTVFLTPAVKKTKLELSQIHKADPKRTNFINEIEMELQAFNTQTSYYGDTLHSLDYDNTLDSDSKSSAAAYVLSPEVEVKSKEVEIIEKKDTPAPSPSHNFFASLFGGDNSSTKQSTSTGFTFSFGKAAEKTDKPQMPMFFDSFKSDKPQQPSQPNAEKPNNHLFFY